MKNEKMVSIRKNITETIWDLIKGKLNEEEIHQIISQIPQLFKYVNNPSPQLELLAVRMLGSNIKYVKQQTETLQRLSVIDDIENIKYIDYPIPEIEEKAMSIFPESFKYLKYPLDSSLLIACTYPGLFKYVKDESPYLFDYSVKKNPENIEYIPNPSLDLQRFAYQSNPSLIEKVHNVDSGLVMEIISNNPYIVTKLQNVTDMQYKAAIKQEPLVLLELDDSLIDKYKHFTKNVLLESMGGDASLLTPEMVKEYPMLVLVAEYSKDFYTFLDIAITELAEVAKLFPESISDEQIPYLLANNGWFIKYIPESKLNDNMVMLALSNGQDYCIQYVNNPSVYIQTYAVEEHASNIQYIKNPHQSVINLAITKSPFAIKYVENPSDFICCKAIRKDPNSIQFIENQSEKMQFIAYKQNQMSAKYFKNVGTTIKVTVLKDHPEYINEPEFKLYVEDLMASEELSNNPMILLGSSKEVVLEYLETKLGN